MLSRLALLLLPLLAAPALANPPVASYIFPAGGQRGKVVPIKVGGLFLHESCPFEVVGSGIQASKMLKRTETLWFDGPLIPLPDSQQAEDYPQDMLGKISIAPDATLGVRSCRLWTSQGAASRLKFIVGELPEIVEEELDGPPIPFHVSAPVTINGRIFPREDIDVWTIKAKKGETFTCTVNAARLGSPLDARLEVLDAKGRVLVENDDTHGRDPAVRFTAPEDGLFQIRIRDANMLGGQSFVYRLSIVSGPFVDRVFPLGGQRGTSLKLELAGHGLTSPTETINLSAEETRDANLFRLKLPGSSVEPMWLDIDDAAEFVEGRDTSTEPINCPVVINGRIARPGELDEWTIAAKKGATLRIEMLAARLGSPLDAIVALVDSAGAELLRVEGDKATAWSVPSDGVFRLRVRDRFQSRGGNAFAYRLKITQPKADFRLSAGADVATVLRKNQAKLKVNVVRSGGFKQAIAVTAHDLPAGVTALPLVVAANQDAGELTLKADDRAEIGATAIHIVGTALPLPESREKPKDEAKVANIPQPTRRATVAGDRGEAAVNTVLLAVALPTPFVIKGEFEIGFAARGEPHRRSYKIERNGFVGPIEIRLADRQARHLQGVTGPVIVVPADKSEFTYEANLPPWMELGRTCRVCVMGTGVIRDGDRDHRVVFSSTDPNEQLVAVVGPGRLGLELGRDSFTGRPGQSIEIPVRVKRSDDRPGPVTVTLALPKHIRAITAEPLVIAADRDRGILTVRVASDAAGPFIASALIRATLEHPDRRSVAEAALELAVDSR